MDFDEAGKGPIIGAFDIVRKTARGKFIHIEVVLKTFTAYTFSRTGFVGAVTMLYILLFIAVHGQLYLKTVVCQLTYAETVDTLVLRCHS